ncbi:MAG: ParB/RepB/Spo0J family partition protein [Bacillota bacterium]|nr:ParB/RepB/Spo0J family partition protein [Bacillota bacterium]
MIEETEVKSDQVYAIDLEKIKPNPFQPRREISEEKIDELAKSIRTSGLIQPIVVRKAINGYELVVGERRFLACRKLGWRKINAAVKNYSDSAMATTALIENLQREGLNYFDEAQCYQNILSNFNLTQETLARQVGKSQASIANKIRLLKFSPQVQKKLLENNLSERHARALLKSQSEEEQLKLIKEIIERGLNVSQAEKRIMQAEDNKKQQSRATRKKPVIRDLRIVLNAIRETIVTIQNAGLYPEVDEKIEKDYIEITIRLTKEMLENRKRITVNS